MALSVAAVFAASLGSPPMNRFATAAMAGLCLLCLALYLRQESVLRRRNSSQRQARVVESNTVEAQVRERTEELTDLARHLQSAREDERKHLARELHDELGALLTAAKLDVARIKPKVVAVLPELEERFVHLVGSLNGGISLKRRIIEDLRPSSLSNLGLVAALEIMMREYEASTGTRVDIQLEPVDLPPEAELTLYRLVQEALTNATKYASASLVGVSLGQDALSVHVRVWDNGVGFALNQARQGTHGLMGMRYRVEGHGGQFTLHSQPGTGTQVSASLPIAAVPPA